MTAVNVVSVVQASAPAHHDPKIARALEPRQLVPQEISDRRDELAALYADAFAGPPSNQTWNRDPAAWDYPQAKLLKRANDDVYALFRLWYEHQHCSRLFAVESDEDGSLIGLGAIEFLIPELISLHQFSGTNLGIQLGDAYQSVLLVSEKARGKGHCSRLFLKGIEFAHRGDMRHGMVGSPRYFIRTLVAQIMQMCETHGLTFVDFQDGVAFTGTSTRRRVYNHVEAQH